MGETDLTKAAAAAPEVAAAPVDPEAYDGSDALAWLLKTVEGLRHRVAELEGNGKGKKK